MSHRWRAASLWLPPLALMALIFWFSAMPGTDPDLPALVVFLRKCAHFGEYALLAALWWRAFVSRLAFAPAIALAVATAIAYAATDEWHQTFVDGRSGSPRDVLLDAAGALTAAALITWSRSRRREQEHA